MVDIPENDNRGISCCAWLGDRCNRPNSAIVLGEHEQTYLEVDIASTGFEVAGNVAQTQFGHFRIISAEF